jgi:hypothetical protein
VKLKHDLHLAYCTNIHRGESWPETLTALQQYTMEVREQVCPDKPYAIGLRLSDLASRQLSQPGTLADFRRWLEGNECYVFTINGFPYGRFHGERVKEQVYRPDWTSEDRVQYTNRLFDILGQLLPEGVEGSVSTVPGSFKEFITSVDQAKQIRTNLFRCVEHIARLSEQTGRKLHLGLEPEPLGFLETTDETVRFFERMRSEFHNDKRLAEFLGVNYDTCHLAIQFEDAVESLGQLKQHGIKISKLHLSSALKTRPTMETLLNLESFVEDTYLHQVVSRDADGKLARHRDLDAAIDHAKSPLEEWRIHFHIPLHSPAVPWFDNTTDHLKGALDVLQKDPKLCSHLEMETYTWEVMPPELKSRSVVEQLTSEYEWCLNELRERDLY